MSQSEWCQYIGELDRPIEDSFIKSHFSMALGIVERIRHDQDEEDYYHSVQPPCYVPLIFDFSTKVSGTGGRIPKA